MATVEFHRRAGSDCPAIVFLHGFTGRMGDTWHAFASLLGDDPELDSWNILSLGYSTSLLPGLPHLWSANPDLTALAGQLATRMHDGELCHYPRLAIFAHSMGGLVVQRALVDHPDLVNRLSHVLLYGTPSDGLRKAGLFRFLTRQVRDMADDSAFMQDLRERRPEVFAAPAFRFRAVAGTRDDFVPRRSTLGPFGEPYRADVEGNHLEIVRAREPSHEGFRLGRNLLLDHPDAHLAGNAASWILTRDGFGRIIERDLPHADALSPSRLVDLALALEECGRRDEATELLARHAGRDTDIAGALGGRFKRAWLQEGLQADFDAACRHYGDGLERAQRAGDHGQIHYHAINLAYLRTVSANHADAEARAHARTARDHAGRDPVRSGWRHASGADAALMLGDPQAALEGYAQACREFGPRDVRPLNSMLQQACHLADVLLGRDRDGWFDVLDDKVRKILP
ncbi:MAG: alpha/beta hydrolase [Geminicoccaceae bacterium]